MKLNLYDEALSGIGEIIELVSESISKEFRGTNPFDKEPMSNEEMLLEYDQMTPQILQQRVQRDGAEATNIYIGKMEGLKQKFAGRQ